MRGLVRACPSDRNRVACSAARCFVPLGAHDAPCRPGLMIAWLQPVALSRRARCVRQSGVEQGPCQRVSRCECVSAHPRGCQHRAKCRCAWGRTHEQASEGSAGQERTRARCKSRATRASLPCVRGCQGPFTGGASQLAQVSCQCYNESEALFLARILLGKQLSCQRTGLRGAAC